MGKESSSKVVGTLAKVEGGSVCRHLKVGGGRSGIVLKTFPVKITSQQLDSDGLWLILWIRNLSGCFPVNYTGVVPFWLFAGVQ